MAYRERQKISQMTPKGAILEATDLIEISELNSGTYVTKSITGQEIIDAASGGTTPDLQQVTDVGSFTTNPISVYSIDVQANINATDISSQNTLNDTYADLSSDGVLFLKAGDEESSLRNTNVTNANVVLEFPNKATGSYTIATTSDIPSTSGFVPYTGAISDVDLGTNKISAKSVYIEGTAGNGHLHLKHQSADATATGQSTSLWANTDGDIKWKNDGNYKTTLKTSGNTADRIYTFPNLDCNLTPDSRTISTTSPLSGGGDLSANRTLSITKATTTTDGYLSSSDWTTFNNKQSALVSGTNIKTVQSTSIVGSGDVTITDANLSMSDITTNNVSITQHGFVPKAPNDTTKFLRGDGTWATAGGGLTVGTTAITSGTDGRVFFQAGGVVQQDAAFFWDNTNKSLEVGGGTSSQETINRLKLGHDNTNQFGYITSLTNSFRRLALVPNSLYNGIVTINRPTTANAPSSAIPLTVQSHNSSNIVLTAVSNSIGASLGIEFNFNSGVGDNTGNISRFIPDVESGGGGGFIWQTAASTTGAYSNRMWLNRAGNLGIGASPVARLDVRSQGALSTDIAFRVRNSADTANIVDVQGNGITTLTNPDAGGVGTSNLQLRVKDVLGNTASFGCGNSGTWIRPYLNFKVNLSSTDVMSLTSTSGLITTDDAVGSRITYSTSNYRVASTLADVTIASTQICLFSSTGVNIGRTSTSSSNGGTNVLEIRNGTIPSSNVTDTFQQYSADITAGNAAPHFRTENGAIVKVYQETTGVAASTLVGGGGTALTDTDTFDGYTLKQIVKALRNQGLLA